MRGKKGFCLASGEAAVVGNGGFVRPEASILRPGAAAAADTVNVPHSYNGAVIEEEHAIAAGPAKGVDALSRSLSQPQPQPLPLPLSLYLTGIKQRKGFFAVGSLDTVLVYFPAAPLFWLLSSS